MTELKKHILQSLQEKKIFIGYYMLCRYLNDRGYTRHGCNAKYNKGKTNGRDRLNPCNIVCVDTKVYYTRVRYWCKKMFGGNMVYLQKVIMTDSINPDVPWYRNAERLDVFVVIARSAIDFQKWWKKNKKDSWRKINEVVI